MPSPTVRLTAASETGERGTDTSDFAPLLREIRALRLLDRAPGYYLRESVVLLLWAVAVGAALSLIGHSWYCLLLAPAAAIWSTRCTYLGHDAAHRQVGRSARVNYLVALWQMTLAAGISVYGWNHRHNQHHAHPNDGERDPNVTHGPLAWTPEQAAARGQFGRWAARRQALLFFPAVMVDAAMVNVAGVHRLARAPARARLVEGTLLLAHTAGYATVLLAVLGPVRALVFAVLHHMLFALNVGCGFAPNHKGMVMLDGRATDFLRRQVLTSRNIRGTALNDWLLGGLNYQIEHHLFPSMPRPHLRRAQPVVRRYCAELGLPYAETGLVESYRIACAAMASAPLRS